MSDRSDLASDAEDMPGVGYGKPPRTTRFVKGQSGNPRGRPRGRHREAPYEAVLGQMVTIREGAVERRVTAAEAFLLQLAKKGLEGDGAAARASLQSIEAARQARPSGAAEPLVVVLVSVGSLMPTLERLGMARKLDRYRPAAKVMLEPWIVEAALARLGDRQLSLAEQWTVANATRTPHRVRWPEWWVVRE
ncbi:DUF5681 domain-containing protein [Phreatobacter sp.]|uniref:DUF5681 domain-containing protein n=1 Tax=Phreatobacter sp. TaxID=1966341 RepID=UPI003F72F4CD